MVEAEDEEAVEDHQVAEGASEGTTTRISDVFVESTLAVTHADYSLVWLSCLKFSEAVVDAEEAVEVVVVVSAVGVAVMVDAVEDEVDAAEDEEAAAVVAEVACRVVLRLLLNLTATREFSSHVEKKMRW